jgi:hypothetical protein
MEAYPRQISREVGQTHPKYCEKSPRKLTKRPSSQMLDEITTLAIPTGIRKDKIVELNFMFRVRVVEDVEDSGLIVIQNIITIEFQIRI